MASILTILVLVGIGLFFYKQGKHTGSRKGYHAGRQHGQRRG